MELLRLGPYPIERVHVNGNDTLRISQNVTDRVNIRCRLSPFIPPLIFLSDLSLVGESEVA